MSKLIRKIASIFCMTALLCSVLPVSFAQAQEPAQKDVDSIVFGNAESEAAHAFSAEGDSSVVTVHESVGEYEVDHTVRKVAGKGSRISFDVSVIKDQELSLEIEEIHGKRLSAFAYRIYVENQPVYVRSFYEESAGPNNYFVRVPQSVTAGKEKVRVTVEGMSDNYFTIKRIWAYSNWDRILEEENAYSKMMLLTLMGNATLPEVFPREVDTLDSIKQKIDNRIKYFGSEYNMFKMGAAGELFYLRNTTETNQRLWDDLLTASMEKDFPITLGINSWWEGTPIGVYDGAGGFFDDIQYSQVCYDPEEVQHMGKYVLTTPNMWSNTPWLTMNDPVLNKARYGWYKKNLGDFSKSMAKMRMENGNKAPYVALYTENEPMYWQLYTFAAARKSDADFNGSVIADAKKDGIDLNPEDGLTREEYEWLFKNVNTNLANTTNAMAEGLGYDYVLVDNGKIMYPESQMIDECYTHINPYKKLSEYSPGVDWSMWETAVTKKGHLGLEENHFLYNGKMTNDVASNMSYMASRGKFAEVNGESTLSGTTANSVKLYYTYGSKYYNDYNTLASHAPAIQAGDNSEGEQVEILSFNDKIFNYKFSEGLEPKTDSPLVKTTNAAFGNAWRHTTMTKGSGTGDNSALFRVDNGKPLSTGLEVDIYCGATDGGAVEIYAGATPDNLSLISTVNEWTCGARFDASEVIDKTQSTAYIMVKCVPAGGYAAVISVGALRPWEEKSGHTDGFLFNRKQMRTRYTYIGARVDAEEMLADYIQKGGEDQYTGEAKALLDAGRPLSAKKVLVQHISELLPAKYMLRGSGNLGKYPIHMESDNKQALNNIVLTKYSDELIEFTIDADMANHVKFDVELPKGSYKVSNEGTKYTIAKCEPQTDGALHVGEPAGDVQWYIEYSGTIENAPQEPQAGTLAFEVDVQKDELVVLEEKFQAITTKPDHNNYPEMAKVSMCDVEKYGYSDGYKFKFAPNAVLRRGVAGTELAVMERTKENMAQISKGELAEITLNAQKEIVSMDVTYGEVTGKITKVEEAVLSPETKPVYLEVEGENGQKYRFEINTNTDLTKSIKAVGGNMLLRAYNKNIGFEVGDSITVTYHPQKYNQEDSYYALKITDGNLKMLLKDDFTDPYVSKRRFDSSLNVTIADLDSTNRIKSLVTQTDGGIGKAAWKIANDKPIENLIVKYSGRAIMGSKLEWYMSTNGYNFTKVEEFVTGTSNIEDFKKVRTFSVKDPMFMGKDTLYLECRLNSQGNTWAALGSIEVYVQD